MATTRTEVDYALRIYSVTLRDAIERLEQHEQSEAASVAELTGLRVAKTLLENMRSGHSIEEAELLLRRAEENHPGNDGFATAAYAIVELLRSYMIRAAADKRDSKQHVVTEQFCGCGCKEYLRRVDKTLYCVRCGIHSTVP